MLSYILLILCLNIDALSYGVATGLKKEKLSLIKILLFSLGSTILFSIPLAISKYVFKYFNRTFCNILNGIILIILGIFYLAPKSEKNQENNKEKTPTKSVIFECITVSVDAMFTALLGGFTTKFFLFFVFFYGFSNFLAIFCGNL